MNIGVCVTRSKLLLFLLKCIVKIAINITPGKVGFFSLTKNEIDKKNC